MRDGFLINHLDGEFINTYFQNRAGFMNVIATNPMADLYRRLKAVGLTETEVRRFILPDWWEDEAAMNPVGFAEGVSYIARYVGLELSALREPGSPLTFRD